MNLDSTLSSTDAPTLSKETIAEGMLAGGRNVTGLSKVERYHLRIAIETLVSQGHNLNDILQTCGTNRAFYFYQIDTIRALPTDTKQAESGTSHEKKIAPAKRMTYDEKLNVMDQVNRLRYVVGLDLREACSRSGISLIKYYKLTLSRKAIVDAIQRGLGKTSDEPRRKRRMRIPDSTDHDQRLTRIARIRRQLTEGANLETILERGGIPRRLYLKWAAEAEQEATKQEQAKGDGEASTLKLWQTYKADTHNEQARNALVAHYLPMVRTIAEKVSLTLPRFVNVNDLIQEGVFGLIDALQRFDPLRGIIFRKYATPRIWGAIMDYLRTEDWAPRSERTRYKQARDDAAAQHSGNGSDHQEHPAEGVPATSPTNGQFFLPTILSMSRPYCENDGRPSTLGDHLTDTSLAHPGDKMDKQEFLHFILQGCNRNERLIMILYYYEEQTMKEIGETLNLSESRVSQMHSDIVLRQNRTLQRRLAK